MEDSAVGLAVAVGAGGAFVGSPFATDGDPPFLDAEPAEDVTPVRPPRSILVGAAAAVAVGAVLWVFDHLGAHAAGYVLSSFVAMGLVVAFHREDARRRQDRRYSPEGRLRITAGAIVVVGIVTAGTHVWVLATHLAT